MNFLFKNGSNLLRRVCAIDLIVGNLRIADSLVKSGICQLGRPSLNCAISYYKFECRPGDCYLRQCSGTSANCHNGICSAGHSVSQDIHTCRYDNIHILVYPSSVVRGNKANSIPLFISGRAVRSLADALHNSGKAAALHSIAIIHQHFACLKGQIIFGRPLIHKGISNNCYCQFHKKEKEGPVLCLKEMQPLPQKTITL